MCFLYRFMAYIYFIAALLMSIDSPIASLLQDALFLESSYEQSREWKRSKSFNRSSDRFAETCKRTFATMRTMAIHWQTRRSSPSMLLARIRETVDGSRDGSEWKELQQDIEWKIFPTQPVKSWTDIREYDEIDRDSTRFWWSAKTNLWSLKCRYSAQ